MKRFLAVVVLSLVVVQLCLLPLAVEGTWGGCPSVTTLPATNITCSTATLNGSVTFPGLSRNIKPNGVVLASLQYTGTVRQAYVSFRYGTAPGVYSNETPSVLKTASGDALATVDVLANISELAPNTTYYVQAKVRSVADASFYQNRNNIQGAGVGLDCTNLQRLYIPNPCPDLPGNVISFTTTGCQTFIGTGSHGSSFSGTTTTTQPMSLPNLVTQSASLSAKTVTPGTPVTVTADIANKSTVNGNKKVTLYVNGQVETTQAVTVNSGDSSKLTFNVSRSEPGDYNVYVDGVPAGSFKVEVVTGPDSILMFSVALIALAFIAGMVMLWRRQRAIPN